MNNLLFILLLLVTIADWLQQQSAAKNNDFSLQSETDIVNDMKVIRIFHSEVEIKTFGKDTAR